MTEKRHLDPSPSAPPPLAATRDVRMKGFAERTTVEAAIHWLDAQLQAWTPPTARLALPLAAGRRLAEAVDSPADVPRFDRAMMDGYAVRGADTQGASGYNPLPLEVIGESLPGRPSALAVGRGQAVRIMTGAPLPPGADAVLPAEYARLQAAAPRAAPAVVEALRDVAPGKHVGRRGEDVRRGERLLAPPRRLRPQDIGLLASIGCGDVAVERPIVARIVVTGNELLPAGAAPEECRIFDSNSPMLAALLRRDGAEPRCPGIVPDDPAAILEALRDPAADLVIVSGGSSVGQEDHAPVLLAEHGQLAVHGIAMRPSSPAGMGVLDGRLVFLLPGNPVSCLCAYDFFAGRAVRRMSGGPAEWPYPILRCRLRRKLVSALGRLDYARVALIDGEAEPLSIAGASALSSTTRAAGFVIVPADSEGLAAGQNVEVRLYDAPP